MEREILVSTSRPLSCHQCRQRKVGCNKVLPCQPCQFSGLKCDFPSGRKQLSRPGNGELLRRITKLEQLILRSGLSGQDLAALESPTPQNLSSANGGASQQSERPTRYGEKVDASESFDGHSFLKSLAIEIDVMRELVEGQSTEEDQDDQTVSKHPKSSAIAGPQFFVPDTKNLRLLYPSAAHALQLSTYYASNVDPMFKILHIPSLESLVTKATNVLDLALVDDSSEALLFAVYYGAITSLTEKECLANLENGKETLLAQYRAGLERALSNANFLRKPDLRSLQAFTIFLVTLQANDNSQLTWTLFAIAVRLGHALGLHRERTKDAFSVLETELRRRLWWQLIVLDGRFATDVARDRFIPPTSFNTEKPLNINDSDIDLDTKMVTERKGPTEMAKCRLTHDILRMAWRLQTDDPPRQGAKAPGMAAGVKMRLLTELERHVEETVLNSSDPSNPIAWATSIIGHITIRRARLVVYYPLDNDQYRDRPVLSRTHLLMTAVEYMEYCNLLDTNPITARWRWFFNNAPVYWYGLSATLAELCVLTKGPVVDRAWAIVDLVYDDWSTRLAKSKDFKAWRPIGKLLRKAQARRSEARSGDTETVMSEHAQHPPSPHGVDVGGDHQKPQLFEGSKATASSASEQSQAFSQSEAMESQGFAGVNTTDLDFDLLSSHMDWTEWDQFAHDMRMEG